MNGSIEGDSFSDDDDMNNERRYISSNHSNINNRKTIKDNGRISKNSSRVVTRVNTARSDGAESYFSLPPMTARSIYVEPQFKRIDLPMMIRVNPLAPPTIPKRTVSMQTIKATDHNKLRALKMQREELARFHAIWSEPVYGDRNAKLRYRRDLRASLKAQIQEMDQKSKDDANLELEWTRSLLRQDNEDRLKELRERIKKLTNGLLVTKRNKEIYELTKEKQRLERQEIISLEQALLGNFPINPRKTLK